MALSFTNEQVANMSKGILTLPSEIATAQQTQTNQVAGKADMVKKDDNNKVFFDNFVNIVNQYHAELRAINGTQKTNYDPGDLDAGARQSPGNKHYPVPPDPVWVNLPPKIIDSNNGNPTTAEAEHEIYWDNLLRQDMGYFLNGFTDGAATKSSTTTYSSTSGVTLNNTTGLATGQKIILYSGSDGLYGTITGVSGNSIGINAIITPSGALNSGSVLQNFMTAFTNTERESGVASLQNIFNGFKSRITAHKTAYKGYLTTEQTALNANDAVTPDKEEIAQARTNVGTILTAITTWEAAPDTGTGTARWGNTKINPFKSAVETRATQITERVAQINLRLGSVSQAGDGNFSGSGMYLKQFDWINMRINKVSGTLTQVYMSDLGTGALNQQTSGLQKQLNEYSAIFSVTKLTSDGNGTNQIQVEDVAAFMPNDSVMIIDDNTNFIERTILSISGKSVTLNGVVSSEFTLDQTARLVKSK